MTPELFSDLAYDLAMGSGPNADDLVSACADLVAQARAEEHAKVEKVRAELATVLKNYEILQGTAIRLEGERDEARVAVAEEQRIADERRTELLEERDQARHDLTEAEAERDEQLREARAAQERLADDMERLITEVTDERRRRADYVRQIETERDAARKQVERVLLLTRPNDLNGGRTPAWISAADLRIALGGTEPGQ